MLSGLLTGCSVPPRVSISEPDALIPLSVGNKWTYKSIGYQQVQEASVIKAESVDNITWYLYKEFGDVFWLSNRKGFQYEAINAFGRFTLPLSIEQEIVFYPPNKSPASYQSSGGLISYRPCSEPITVPAGTFSCYIYSIDMGLGNSSTNYYALGVGLVRNEFTTPNGTVIYELVDYSVR